MPAIKHNRGSTDEPRPVFIYLEVCEGKLRHFYSRDNDIEIWCTHKTINMYSIVFHTLERVIAITIKCFLLFLLKTTRA